MERIDPIEAFYRLALRISNLKAQATGNARAWLSLAQIAVLDIEAKVGKDGLRLIPEIAESLYKVKLRIRNLESAIAKKPEYRLSEADTQVIRDDLDTFEATFSGALRSRYFYFVREKGGYSTVKLIEEPESFFGSVWPRLPTTAQEDCRQAALCLAFDLPTACGFHSVRAVESLLRRWYDKVLGAPATPDDYPNMGQCIDQVRKELKKAGGPSDAQDAALNHLDTIRKLDRNPLMHPEVSLDQEEAIQIFGKSNGALTSLVKYIL